MPFSVAGAVASGRLLLAAAAAVLLSGGTAAAQLPGPVVATIKPIHSLVAAVMEGVGEPELLVPGNVSAHTFTMRPSQAIMLSEASLVFWVGEGLETFLHSGPGQLGRNATWVELGRAEGVELLAVRNSGVWEVDPTYAAAHAHFYDAHFWLDPENAIAAVDAIAEALEAADPVNAGTYAANAAAYSAELAALATELELDLAAVRSVPFVVLHDGYQYFERRFGLTGAGAVVISPEIPPGARRLVELRQAISDRGARCVFAEPQYATGPITTLADGLDVRIGMLDTVGAAIPEGPDLYPALLRQLASSLIECLGAGV